MARWLFRGRAEGGPAVEVLGEIALTPDVFDGACYSTADACDLHLRYLKDPLLNEVMVRNLRDGTWSQVVGEMGRLHPKAKELLRKLATRNRLRLFPAASPAAPTSDDEWCDEAIATHALENVAAILSTDAVAQRHAACPVVYRIERVSGSRWWHDRTPSVQVPRNIGAYLQALRLVLANANSLMFIDPHLDPSRPRYRNFVRLLLASRRAPPARLEVHRVCYEGSGPNRVVYTGAMQPQLENKFRNGWTTDLRNAGLVANIYVWPDFHDRYLITDLIGIALSNGFDESGDVNARVMLSRLGKTQADDVQRQYDPAVVHPHYVFHVP